MSNKPLVSIIVTTKNEESHIDTCLKSISQQSYKNLEIIVVDNNSSDKTKEISKRYTNKVFNKGPERSAQRNFGAKKASGDYVLFIDADMILGKNVIRECVIESQKSIPVQSGSKVKSQKLGGIVIPEKSQGLGFWAKVKAYERSFYEGDNTVEAARFYKREAFEKTQGFDEKLTGPEDWDLSDRVRRVYRIARIKSYILHNEGRLSLVKILKKKYYYAKSARAYLSKNKKGAVSAKTIPLLRPVFYRNPSKIISRPILFCAMIFLLSLELAVGFFGFIQNK